ncbi:MAG: carboxypeptidase regulatory-like domain-containing protein [Pirellulales bacterium]
MCFVRRIAIAVVVVSLSAAFAWAAEESGKTWRIEGRVVDADSQPVAGAEVFVPQPPGDTKVKHSTTSDAKGHFQLDSPLAPAGLTLQASHDDGKRLACKRLAWELKPDAPVESVELILRPARELSIAVVDDKQQPVAGAAAIAVANFQKIDGAATDGDGRAKLTVPADAELSSVVAIKPGMGVDYVLFRGENEPTSDPYKLAPDHTKPLEFELNGTRHVTVRVVDDQDKPLVGTKVYPWLINKPRKGDQLNLSGLEAFSAKTDNSGVATFDVIPVDNERGVTFWVHVPGYADQRLEYKPIDEDVELVARLVPLVSVSGLVTFADGRPAASIGVQLSGAGYSMDRGRESTTTDAEGKFTVDVVADQYYQIAAGDREWASPPVNRLVLQGKPVTGVELILEPAKRVHGRVTIGADHKPVPGSYVQLYQKNAVDYYDLPESERLPNPTDSNLAIQPLIAWGGPTDDAGQFEFFVGPGKYYMFGPNGVDPPKFEISDQPSIEVNLHAERPDRVPIMGRVVLKDAPAEGVADVRIEGVPKQSRLRDLRATSGADGKFASERGPADMVVYAATPDRKLAGVITIGPDDAEVVIPIGPTSSAHGQLLDKETGQPLANRQIEYGIRIDFEDGTFSWRFGGSATTDERGELTIDGLVVGQEYALEAVTEIGSDGRPRSWTGAGKVTATSTAVAEMGDVLVKPPYRAPTTAERVTKLFSEERSLDERFDARVRDAGFGYQNVLVIVGDPTNSQIQQIYDLEYDPALGDAAMDYLFLPVSICDPQQLAVAEQSLAPRKIALPAAGAATLAVVDKTGALIAQSASNELVSDGKIDGEKLRSFLAAHAPPLPDAEALFTDALAQAKREDKRVFVQCSGPRCGWCLVLARFLDDQRDIFKKEFVYLKLDSRLGNGQAVIDRVRPDANGGIPWFVILDADGNELINSDGPSGNIGYPGEPEGQVHFEKMLRTAPRHITDEEIKSLVAALTAKD